MRRPLDVPAVLTAALLAAAPAFGASVRTLEHTQPAGSLTGVRITAGVGEVEVLGDPGNEIRVRVEVKAKRAGLFGSRSAERDLDALAIEPSASGTTLSLRVAPPHGDETNYSESWTIYVPSSFAATVKLGVGDVSVLDLSGDLAAELGVGDVKVEGPYPAFGTIHASCGVGDATLRTPEHREDGEGFIAHHLSAQGPGKGAIRAEVGVGDVTIRLR